MRMEKLKTVRKWILICSTFFLVFCQAVSARLLLENETAVSVKKMIESVNDYWQATHPVPGNAFWHTAAYHTGNMAAYVITGKKDYRLYSEKWAEFNQWKGAKSTDIKQWKYNYGESDEYVLFGDWQICFQTYIDLYNLDPEDKKIARAREVMEYQMSTPFADYWWWADGLYMVMPVMTKLYRVTGNAMYLDKLDEYFTSAKALMYDGEKALFYRDEKYVFPEHKTKNGKKDFWARGNGWVFAALAKVLNDLPETDFRRENYIRIFRSMAEALKSAQLKEGYWSRSLLDSDHAPGYETSGTAFFTYGYLWGINHHILDRKTYLPVVDKAWGYLTRIALQPDGKIGYVQPIGERADQHQDVGPQTTADFGVGAFLLAASEAVRFLEDEVVVSTRCFTKIPTERVSEEIHPLAFAGNSVNAVVFRKNSLVTHGHYQFMAYYDDAGYLCLGKRKQGRKQWKVYRTNYTGNIRDAHNSISIMTDGDGYLHICWDHHGNALNYARSVEPLSLMPGEKQSMTSIAEQKVTYPEFYSLPAGDLIFMSRDGSSGKGNLSIKKYDVRLKHWTQLHKNLIDGEGRRNAYWQACTDSKGIIHLSWVWRESPDVASNHDLCYARSLDGGVTWEDAGGNRYRLPITSATAEYVCRIPQNSELINQTSMTVDKNGFPYIATYYKNGDSYVPQYHVVYRDESGWRSLNAGFRKTPFSLKGTGTKSIPVSRPQILVDESKKGKRIILVFRDVERNGKVSAAMCTDVESNRWVIRDITDYSVGDWEPAYDTELWKREGILQLYVQRIKQVDGEGLSSFPAQPVSVLTVPLKSWR